MRCARPGILGNWRLRCDGLATKTCRASLGDALCLRCFASWTRRGLRRRLPVARSHRVLARPDSDSGGFEEFASSWPGDTRAIIRCAWVSFGRRHESQAIWHQNAALLAAIREVTPLIRRRSSSPDIAPTFSCGGPMARPDRRSLGRDDRHTVKYACASLGRERQSCRTFEPPRDERWCNIRASA